MIPDSEKARLGQTLLEGADQLQVAIAPAQLQLLLTYVEELARWNAAYNLTAVRAPREMIFRHLLDSLTVLPHLEGMHLLDLGSGAGLPGMVLAIMESEREFVLLEANGKKTSFLRHVKACLKLSNVTVLQARAEAHRPVARYASVICRALAALPVIADLSRPLLVDQGRILAMKGVYPEPELARLPADFRLRAVHRLQVPGLAEDRHLVEIEKLQA